MNPDVYKDLKQKEISSKFKDGARVKVVSGLCIGYTGVIKESLNVSDHMEYHVVLDNEDILRVYFEEKLEEV